MIVPALDRLLLRRGLQDLQRGLFGVLGACVAQAHQGGFVVGVQRAAFEFQPQNDAEHHGLVADAFGREWSVVDGVNYGGAWSVCKHLLRLVVRVGLGAGRGKASCQKNDPVHGQMSCRQFGRDVSARLRAGKGGIGTRTACRARCSSSRRGHGFRELPPTSLLKLGARVLMPARLFFGGLLA